MYGISKNKHFNAIFMKKKLVIKNNLVKNNYNTSENKIFNNLSNKYYQNHYISNIYICRHTNWIFLYLFIYRPATKTKTYRQKSNKLYFNKSLFNQIDSQSKLKFFK